MAPLRKLHALDVSYNEISSRVAERWLRILLDDQNAYSISERTHKSTIFAEQRTLHGAPELQS